MSRPDGASCQLVRRRSWPSRKCLGRWTLSVTERLGEGDQKYKEMKRTGMDSRNLKQRTKSSKAAKRPQLGS